MGGGVALTAAWMFGVAMRAAPGAELVGPLALYSTDLRKPYMMLAGGAELPPGVQIATRFAEPTAAPADVAMQEAPTVTAPAPPMRAASRRAPVPRVVAAAKTAADFDPDVTGSILPTTEAAPRPRHRPTDAAIEVPLPAPRPHEMEPPPRQVASLVPVPVASRPHEMEPAPRQVASLVPVPVAPRPREVEPPPRQVEAPPRNVASLTAGPAVAALPTASARPEAPSASAPVPSRSASLELPSKNSSIPAARENPIGGDGHTAIYDIVAHTVYLPGGERLEAHSGLGRMMDDPRFISQKNRGATPPNLYDLELRSGLFHGVQALRLNPAGEAKMYGRDGILAHTYMLGPSGQSFGCVSFRNYAEFLHAFMRGEVKRLVVVTHLDTEPFGDRARRAQGDRSGQSERYAFNRR